MTEWTEVVQLHGPVVWRTAYRLLGNESDTSDCFQRTFVSALELSRKETIRQWAPLLRRIAIARALDCLRQKQREASRGEGIPEGDIVDVKAIDPVQAAESGELARQLRNALGHLDPKQAEVFCMACLEDMSYQEIARQIGITVNHVGVLLNRAKVGLRQRLRDYKASGKECFGNEVEP